MTVTVYEIAPKSPQSAEGSTGMARIARLVVPGLSHHVTQRGNRREPRFFAASDYRLYRRLIATAARRHSRPGLLPDAQFTSTCQSCPLGVTPADEDGLRAAFAEAHRRDQHSLPLDGPSNHRNETDTFWPDH